MSNTNFDELLNAGCHFGHLTRKWNPKMAPYIFMERNDIHIIDLNKTAIMLDKASAALKQIAKSGRRILFVATKKQAKDIVAEKISNIHMPLVTERWLSLIIDKAPGALKEGQTERQAETEKEGHKKNAEKVEAQDEVAEVSETASEE